MAMALLRIPAALILAPVLASAQPALQSPPASFQTPSGNVHCLMRAEVLRCDVLERDHNPPPQPRDCPQGWRGGLALRTAGETALLCDAGTVRDDEAFVLGYGARWLGPGITCESHEAGLRCANGAGRGFQASRSRLTLF
jgi:hypothetical protein